MSNFCLKQGQGLKALAAHLFPNFPCRAPPPPPGIFLEVKFWSRDFFRVLVEALGMSYQIDFNLYRNDLYRNGLVWKLPGNLT